MNGRTEPEIRCLACGARICEGIDETAVTAHLEQMHMITGDDALIKAKEQLVVIE